METIKSKQYVNVISNYEEFDNAFKILKEQAIISHNPVIYHIGLDIEYINKTFYPIKYENNKYQNKHSNIIICQIQIAAGNQIFIIEIYKMMLHPRLKDILISSTWIKSGVDIYADLVNCFKCFDISGIPQYIDLKTFAILEDIEKPNLENLISIELKKEFTKKSTSICDWSVLDDKLLQYAAEDAYYSYVLAKKYLPGNKDYIVLECELIYKSLICCNIIEEINLSFEKSLCMSDNYIGIIQEMMQKNNKELPKYIEQDKDNNQFVIRCEIQIDNILKSTIGMGLKKQDAKKHSARLMLELLNI